MSNTSKMSQGGALALARTISMTSSNKATASGIANDTWTDDDIEAFTSYYQEENLKLLLTEEIAADDANQSQAGTMSVLQFQLRVYPNGYNELANLYVWVELMVTHPALVKKQTGKASQSPRIELLRGESSGLKDKEFDQLDEAIAEKLDEYKDDMLPSVHQVHFVLAAVEEFLGPIYEHHPGQLKKEADAQRVKQEKERREKRHKLLEKQVRRLESERKAARARLQEVLIWRRRLDVNKNTLRKIDQGDTKHRAI